MTYDWIVVGGGIAGASLCYELARQSLRVLLLEQDSRLEGATRYSYGGVAYWAGTTPLTQQLGTESLAKYHQLTAELGAETEFRELDLVMTIPVGGDVAAIAQAYAACAIPPRSLTPAEAVELEPCLNPDALAGALTCRHGHMEPTLTTMAYRQAAMKLGAVVETAKVRGLQVMQQGETHRIQGVMTDQTLYSSNNVVIAAGGYSRALLKSSGISLPLHFTHAELIETPPLENRLRALVMPAQIHRFQLERQSTRPEVEALWDQPGQETAPPILDAGAIQFRNGRVLMGQISRTLTDPQATVTTTVGEMAIRTAVGAVLPGLQHVPGTWHKCLVAFSRDQMPIVGAVPGRMGLHLFTSFSNPLTLIPPIAQRFAAHVTGSADPILDQLAPARLLTAH